MILILLGEVNLYESLLLDLLELIHCVVFELVFLPNRLLKNGGCFDIMQCNCC